jgi:hypothetical protein
LALKANPPVFVVSDRHAPASHNHRSANQIRIHGHHSDSFSPGRRMVLHLLLAVDFAARVQEILVVAFANQFLKFRRSQAVLDQIADIQMLPALLQGLARFSAGRTS